VAGVVTWASLGESTTSRCCSVAYSERLTLGSPPIVVREMDLRGRIYLEHWRGESHPHEFLLRPNASPTSAVSFGPSTE
jgi:hypothetical protein